MTQLQKRQMRKFARPLTDFLFIQDEMKKADVIFIPGNRYPQMAERAAELYREGYAPYVLPSGRYAMSEEHFAGPAAEADRYRGPYGTEWEFLTDVLAQNGVPRAAILKEDEARFTYDNAIFSRRVTDAAGIRVRRAILCASTIHARRCQMYYQLLYPETEILVAAVDACGITAENWMDSGTSVDAVVAELVRCGGQFREILQELV